MPSPTERNRLDGEASPYLQAHADNPVNWQPWDDRALAAARERDVPLFVSIGYSSCHWCHVMAEESFEDPAIAERLNDEFVPIKVDREERPEIDAIYMAVCRLVTRGGCGWPLSVWCTPEGEPFYVGTYFPPESRHGRPGFADLLDDIVESWRTDRGTLEERADQWMGAARQELEDVPTAAEAAPDHELLDRAAKAFVRRADRTHGGFGTGQKFPQVGLLLALARASDRVIGEEYRDVFRHGLDAMADGGLRDHLGGGFHRYCTDRTWTVPHFEKMLYDNAEIPRAFLVGYQLTGEDRYADVARETFDFLEAELRHPDGGFYSTLDARSPPIDGGTDAAGHGEEGVFYTWTPETVTAAMGEYASAAKSDAGSTVLAELFCDRFGVTEAGNFEGETVLTIGASIDDLAEDYDRDPATAGTLLEAATARAKAAREDRPRPPRDEKVLAGWNGLAIAALAEGGLVLEDRYADLATDALAFVREHLWDGDRLAHRFKDGEVKGDGYLEDYAFLARGALACYEATGEVDHLGFALDLGRAIAARFYDADRGTLYFTDRSASDLPVRPQEVADGSTPSSAGVAVQVLATLHEFDPDAGFADVADDVLATYADRMAASPGQYATMVLAADDRSLGHLEVTVAGDDLPDDWRSLLGRRYVPARLLTRRPPDEAGLSAWLEELGLTETPPIWAGREARDGPTAFVCRGACSPPLTATEDVAEWIEEFRPIG